MQSTGLDKRHVSAAHLRLNVGPDLTPSIDLIQEQNRGKKYIKLLPNLHPANSPDVLTHALTLDRS